MGSARSALRPNGEESDGFDEETTMLSDLPDDYDPDHPDYLDPSDLEDDEDLDALGLPREAQTPMEMMVESERNADPYKLEPDAFSLLLAQLIRPGKGPWRCIRVIAAALLLVIVVSMQILIVLALYRRANAVLFWKDNQFFTEIIKASHLSFEPGEHHQDVATRIAPDIAEEVCGKFLKHSIGDLYWYTAVHDELWTNPLEWEDDMSKLQQAIQALELTNPRRVACYVFVIALMAWTAAVMRELKNIFLFLDAASNARVLRGASGFELDPTRHVKLIKESDGRLTVTGISLCAYIFVWIIVLLRGAIACFLFLSGILFLQTSFGIADLIMNAVALVFVLELDELACVGLNFFSRGLWINSIQFRVDIDDSKIATENKHCVSWSLLSIAGIVIVAMISWLQVRLNMESKFNAWSTICLYNGPPPDMELTFNASFPVPGICEGLVCKYMYATKHECIPRSYNLNEPKYAVTGFEQASAWTLVLFEQCHKMLQMHKQRKYDIYETWESANASGRAWPQVERTGSLGERQVDEDLQDVLDDAGDFWCPNQQVNEHVLYHDWGHHNWHWLIFFFTRADVNDNLHKLDPDWSSNWSCQYNLSASLESPLHMTDYSIIPQDMLRAAQWFESASEGEVPAKSRYKEGDRDTLKCPLDSYPLTTLEDCRNAHEALGILRFDQPILFHVEHDPFHPSGCSIDHSSSENNYDYIVFNHDQGAQTSVHFSPLCKKVEIPASCPPQYGGLPPICCAVDGACANDDDWCCGEEGEYYCSTIPGRAKEHKGVTCPDFAPPAACPADYPCQTGTSPTEAKDIIKFKDYTHERCCA